MLDEKKYLIKFTGLKVEILRNHQKSLQQLGVRYDDLCDIVSYICFISDCLCISTVSFPAISNIIMHDCDEALCSYCDSRELRYSRYADDIYISSHKYLPNEIRDSVTDELSANGFIVNTSKTWFRSKKDRPQITGLILT